MQSFFFRAAARKSIPIDLPGQSAAGNGPRSAKPQKVHRRAASRGLPLVDGQSTQNAATA